MDFVQHHAIAILVSWWIFSAAVSAMPTPTDKSSPWYSWAFTFCHTLAGSIARAAAAKYPQLFNQKQVPPSTKAEQ